MFRKIAAGVLAAIFAAVVAVTLLTNHSYVTTPSMYPTIPPGSEIFVSHENHYRVGQVIEFRANHLVWAHRLIEIKPDGSFVTKGDNPLNSPDVFVPPLTQADVIGAVNFAPKWLGFPELILHRPSYGMAWLRAELGIWGRVALIAATLVSVLVWPTGKNHRADATRKPARHRAVPVPANAPVRKRPIPITVLPSLPIFPPPDAPTAVMNRSDLAALSDLLLDA
jgi:signal peptidase I